ncbi:MAG: hypothetical protein ABIL77_01730 [candidate division WOR-3 bacterium]
MKILKYVVLATLVSSTSDVSFIVDQYPHLCWFPGGQYKPTIAGGTEVFCSVGG